MRLRSSKMRNRSTRPRESKNQKNQKNEKIKKNKGENMSPFGWWRNGVWVSGQSGVVKELPKTGNTLNTLNIVLFKQSLLDKYWDTVREKAGGNEVQLHYRGVQIFIEKTDGRKVLFTIPTVFFNMRQRVSTGSVDFSLDEVSEISQQVKPISLELAQDIVHKFPVSKFQDAGCSIRIEELEMGSLHRHPGNFSFSGIDLDNRAENPGIIFRNLEATGKHQVDSVMYIPTDSVQLVTTQTRVVDVSPTENGGITGWYRKAPTLTYVLQDVVHVRDFADFFDLGKSAQDVEEFKFIKQSDEFNKQYEGIEETLVEFLKAGVYEPEMFVDPELIITFGGYGHAARNKNAYGSVRYFDEDDEDLEGVGYKYTKESHAPTTPMAPKYTYADFERPNWRWVTTINALKSKGINLASWPEIDGSASNKDIAAVVAALREQKVPLAEVRQFFLQMEYPKKALELFMS